MAIATATGGRGGEGEGGKPRKEQQTYLGARVFCHYESHIRQGSENAGTGIPFCFPFSVSIEQSLGLILGTGEGGSGLRRSGTDRSETRWDGTGQK